MVANKDIYVVSISPCPNDIFCYLPMMEGLVPCLLNYRWQVKPIHELNRSVLSADSLFSKVSVSTYLKVSDQFWVLPYGAAFGHQTGPKVVGFDKGMVIRGKVIAVPGFQTSAYVLMKHYFPENKYCEFPFQDIPKAVRSHHVDGGVVIHESGNQLDHYNLEISHDLGELWFREFSLPLPLGCFVASKKIPNNIIKSVSQDIKSSIAYAWNHFEQVLTLAKKYSVEKELNSLLGHVKNYVSIDKKTKFTVEEMLALRSFSLTCKKVGICADANIQVWTDMDNQLASGE